MKDEWRAVRREEPVAALPVELQPRSKNAIRLQVICFGQVVKANAVAKLHRDMR